MLADFDVGVVHVFYKELFTSGVGGPLPQIQRPAGATAMMSGVIWTNCFLAGRREY
ncbi:hypothetical protein PDN33_28455 [Bacillus cereus]|nr:hypothetical protein [Bacillus cereus]